MLSCLTVPQHTINNHYRWPGMCVCLFAHTCVAVVDYLSSWHKTLTVSTHGLSSLKAAVWAELNIFVAGPRTWTRKWIRKCTVHLLSAEQSVYSLAAADVLVWFPLANITSNIQCPCAPAVLSCPMCRCAHMLHGPLMYPSVVYLTKSVPHFQWNWQIE